MATTSVSVTYAKHKEKKKQGIYKKKKKKNKQEYSTKLFPHLIKNSKKKSKNKIQ